MLDIGLGEVIIIAIIALLVFGPEKLPKMAADAAKTLRQVRQMASAARKDLSDAAGLHDDAGLGQTVRDIQSLDPRRALRGLGDDPAPGASPAAGPAGRPAQRRAPQPSAGATPAGAGTGGGPAAGPAGPAAQGASSSTASAGGALDGPTSVDPAPEPVAGPVLEPEPVDPDWT